MADISTELSTKLYYQAVDLPSLGKKFTGRKVKLPVSKVILNAGDFLFLPPWWWHEITHPIHRLAIAVGLHPCQNGNEIPSNPDANMTRIVIEEFNDDKELSSALASGVFRDHVLRASAQYKSNVDETDKRKVTWKEGS